MKQINNTNRKPMSIKKEEKLNKIIDRCCKKLADGNGSLFHSTIHKIILVELNGRIGNLKTLNSILKIYETESLDENN